MIWIINVMKGYLFTEKRISLVPPFPGIRRFAQGRRFKQWTGDDSKALMKVIPCTT